MLVLTVHSWWPRLLGAFVLLAAIGLLAGADDWFVRAFALSVLLVGPVTGGLVLLAFRVEALVRERRKGRR
ncbi:MAG: hypothetical protein JW751_25720 [Polyangiaceae bacterium]|nr:hypothetical protein [Polyangiaceae bacterium]